MLTVVKDLGMIHHGCVNKARWVEAKCSGCNRVTEMRKHRADTKEWCKDCARRSGTLATDGKKKCSTCKVVKSTDMFSSRKDSTDGLRSQCSACISTASAVRWKTLPEFKQRGLERSRRFSLMRNYGITLDEFNKMNATQGSKCKICDTHVNKLAGNTLYIDHCHITGAIRGLLCSRCNSGIGMMNDNIDTVRSALRYLEQDYTKNKKVPEVNNATQTASEKDRRTGH